MTEPARPKGLPIATTSWPTVSRSASPSVAARQVRAVGAQHGEVGERVRADEREGQVAAVGEARPQAAAGALDDVGGGEQEAVGRDDDAAAAPLPWPPRRSRRTTRMLATDGPSVRATALTARE